MLGLVVNGRKLAWSEAGLGGEVGLNPSFTEIVRGAIIGKYWVLPENEAP